MTQKEALLILKSGRNCFVTGPAGSGKTHLVNEYIKYLKSHSIPVGITASTGIAATHMGGLTIHSWSGISVKDDLSDEEIAEIGDKAYVRKKIEEAKVLIIDEVSMLHHFRFDLVNRVLKHIRKSEAPFGGLQVVLCGDFFQLPPVSRMGEPKPEFIFKSDAWKEGAFSVLYLDQNFRQKDDPAVRILNEIRSGSVSEEMRELLLSRHVRNSDEKEIDIGEGNEKTRLFTHNMDVDALNETALEDVDEIEITYEMTSSGNKHLVEALKKSCLAPEKLRIKKGARVMCVKNNFEKGYVNGTLGVVVSCGAGVDPVIRTAGTPDHPDGRLLTIEEATWVIDDMGKSLAEIHQYPLRLAWAITVHKSQGMSLDEVEVDLSKSFEPGMGYVALSRVRTLEGLKILGINENALRVHPEVLAFDKALKESSRRIESILFHSSKEEIEEAHKSFIAKTAPLHKLREKKLTTYEKTAALIFEEKSLKDISKSRGIEEETVISQIEHILQGGKGAPKNLRLTDIQYLKREIRPAHWKKLEKALEEVADKDKEGQAPLLGPVKNIVGPNISWKEIRLARALLGYIK